MFTLDARKQKKDDRDKGKMCRDDKGNAYSLMTSVSIRLFPALGEDMLIPVSLFL